MMVTIGVGDEYSKEVLQKFINNPEIEPLVAKGAKAIADSTEQASLNAIQEAVSQI